MGLVVVFALLPADSLYVGSVCNVFGVSATGRLLSGWLMWGKCFRAVSRWESLV